MEPLLFDGGAKKRSVFFELFDSDLSSKILQGHYSKLHSNDPGEFPPQSTYPFDYPYGKRKV
jgi:hypothetical protein